MSVFENLAIVKGLGKGNKELQKGWKEKVLNLN